MGAVLTDFSKAIDCIPHDLLIAKLAANGFDLNAFPLIFRNLKKREQSVLTNNTHSSFGNVISGVSRGSIVKRICFSLSMTCFTLSKKSQYSILQMIILCLLFQNNRRPSSYSTVGILKMYQMAHRR